ncbi:EamA family transporter RarD [Kangiella sediminilitoris]|uniref:RarD protein, DMT superfamily transporter n=1 Tax=Kangiella sediminilitoris TaxID=1144748 RepID=A0A1B3BDL8_9GAMM|nr:EamA family transporter RarD [Kangiella sediminilitoris]AOE50901.1 RarD protein, DMT superfamily transporter [Kangiella sediminilitoris]
MKAENTPTQQSTNSGQEEPSQKTGYVFALGAFIIWGLAPIYFKALQEVSALEILAHRVAWSVPVVLLIMWAIKRPFPKGVLRDRKTMGILFITSILISGNWLVFTWAVTHDRVLETSLGYFINPLISVALGILFLKEKLTFWSKLALGLAIAGVGYRIYVLEGLPWVSLVLAFSFGFYGLLRKQVNIGPLQGLLVETLIVLPVTAGYIYYLWDTGTGKFLYSSVTINWLLVAGGVITTIPLALFSAGARILPLNTIGFIQYLAPSLTFLLAVFAFKEPLDLHLLATFALIWAGLVAYTIGVVKQQNKRRRASRLTAKKAS